MTQSVLENKNWLEFWKQGWRIHCGAASEGSQEEVEAHPGGPAEATPGAERESRCVCDRTAGRQQWTLCPAGPRGMAWGRCTSLLSSSRSSRPALHCCSPRALWRLLTGEADVSGCSWILRSREGVGPFGLGRVMEKKIVQEMRAL